ncbi:branched-chain amino acid ABC transporter permease [Aeromicrobium tamlense]|uniref:Branched-chain amino acid ABC transporter permease n=1 Tax=Aeromicrobium tamlense TaxID=375541 RepID=A0A8I0KNT5_9ACTN|nr:branched-chain amino acid ABC transporter permease [Aeromicrobium tamlense]MBD1270749.1 branched-chain amino acid ABC transporter permease [Aeromicrobium tamlense]MBD1271119.1 branched-chain amino acid ABC transporter permease [Aeromicrobium tamlense]NYI38141.1 branched-chain amino acid transport system permease protein [Aeromicrobium tamlense]
MSLLLGALITGLALGMVIGLLGFSIVLLHKATGVANFAQGALATMAAFITLQVARDTGLGVVASAGIGLIIMIALGGVVYIVLLRPADSAGSLNITMRSLALLLLLVASTRLFWGHGQPFRFPAIFPRDAAFTIGGAPVSWLTLGTIAVAAILAVGMRFYFSHTRTGLTFLALAANADVARLLGVRTRRLTMLAWAFASGIAAVVAVLIAPIALVSSEMMDVYLLLAFASAVIGGLDSLGGVFLGGIIIGIANSTTSVYVDSETATLVVFALVLSMLVARPQGIFGASTTERL